MKQLISRYIKHGKGFSLIEMSVVLASVAAVISITAGGVSMINKTRLGDVVGEVARFSKAIEAFEKQFGGIPGDLASVGSLSGATAGNGNGAIDTAAESLHFWKDLSLAQLIKGNYDGSSTYIPGTGVPASSIKNGGYNVLNPTSVSGAPSQAIIIELAGFSSSSNALAILKPEDARSIDAKADDGNPDTGIIRATGSGSGGNCVSSGAYNLSNNTISCQLRFIINSNAGKGDAATVTGACTVLGSTRVSTDTAATCPIGYVGKAVETCRINSSNVGVWEATGKYCDIVTCDKSKYGDSRSLACINNMTASGGAPGSITQTCTENGIWKTTATTCSPDLLATCTNGATRTPQACDLGQTGRILYNACASSKWGVVSSNNCAAITCSGAAIGSNRTYSGGCGTNYTGTAKEVCTILGTWAQTSVGASCVPTFGSCTAGSDADRSIGCPTGKTGTHTQTCVDNGSSDYWATKVDNCVPITCDGGENLGSTRVREGETCTYGRAGTVLESCTSDGGNPAKGVWTVSYSNCTAACDGSLDTLGNAVWPSTAAGVTATGTCTTNFEQGGAEPTRDCNADGTWSSTVTDPCTKYQCDSTTINNATWPAVDSGTKNVAGQCTWPTYQGQPHKDCSATGAWGTEITPCVKSLIPKTSNLTFWLDADDPSTLFTDSSCTKYAGADDGVGCWKDKSGTNTADVLQGTAASQPILKRNRQNSKPAVIFDGTDDWLQSASTIGSAFSGTDYITIFLVAKSTSGTTPIAWASGSANRFALAAPSNIYGFDFYGSPNTRLSGTTSMLNTWGIVTAIKTSSNQYIYVNGGLDNSMASAMTIDTTGSSVMSIGRWAGGGFNFGGEIGEILIYKEAITTADQTIVHNYLAKKWNLPLMLPVSGSTFWLDAADSGTIFTDTACTTSGAADASLVMCWKDKSNNAKHATNPTANTARPAYKTAIQNSKNVVRFDGSNDYLNTASVSATTFFATDQVTAFFVSNPTNTSAYQSAIIWQSVTDTNRFLIEKNGSADTYPNSYRMDFPNRTAALQSSNVTAKWSVATFRKTATDTYAYNNGTLEGKNANTATLSAGNSVLSLGRWPGSATYQWAGDMGEIVLYNTALGYTDRLAMEAYLGDKWNITMSISLPSPDPTFWLDAADSATMFTATACTGAAVDGSSVACWQDKSSNAKNVTQSTAANRPVYKTAIQNSKNIVRLDGTNDVLATASTTGSNFFSSNSNTIFFVSNPDVAHNGTRDVPFTWATAANTNLVIIKKLTSDKYAFDFPNNSTGELAGTSSPAGAWSIYSFLKTATGSYMYRNGTLESYNSDTGTLTVSGSAAINIGYNTIDAWYDGDIGEVIVYKTSLSTNDRKLTQQYLGTKWGITITESASLPPGTPTFWLDASDSSTVFTAAACTGTASNNSNVACWKDKSTNAYDMTNNNAAPSPPVYKTAQQNGLNAVWFDDTNSQLASSSITGTTLISATEATIFITSKEDNSSSNNPLIQWKSSGSNNFSVATNTGTAGFIFEYPTNGSGLTGSAAVLNRWSIYSFVKTPANMYIYSDGASDAYRSDTASFTQVTESRTLYIGRWAGGGSNWAGYIGEILIYKTALTDTDRQSAEAYLGEKWGITVVKNYSNPNPNSTFWLDAADANTVFTAAACTGAAADASLVMCWKDKSTNAKHATQSVAGTARPAYKTAIQNSLNVMRFDGTTDVLNTASMLGSTFLGSTEATIFLTMNETNTGSQQNQITWSAPDTSNRLVIQKGSGDKYNFNYPNNGAANLVGTHTITNIWAVNSFVKTAANQYMYFNGALSSSQANAVSMNTANSASIYIGSNGSGANFTAGDIGEILIYKTALNDADRIAMETYLGNKWGITVTATYTNPTSGQTFWVDASDSSTLFTATGCTGAIASNSAIACWQDKSSNAKHLTQSTSGSRPTYKTSIQNSLNVARFSADYMGTASTTGSVFFGTSQSSIFLVSNPTDSGSLKTALSWQANDHNNRVMVEKHSSNVYRFDFPNFYGGGKLDGATNSINRWSVYSFIKSPTNQYIYNNGGLDASKANTMSLTNTASKVLYVGVDVLLTSRAFDGDIGEILIYKTGLSDSDRLATERYLGQKWNITVQ